MRLCFLSTTATLVVVSACGPRTTTPTPAPATPVVAPPPSPVSAPPRGGTDVIRLGPSALRYVVHQQFHIEQQFQGQTQTIDRGIRLFISATIFGPADSVGYPVTFAVDSIVPDSGSIVPPTLNLASARGLRYMGHLTTAGEFRQTGTSDATLAQTFTQLVGGFRNFYPRIPAGGLTLGADWTDTSSTSDRAAIDVTVKAIAHSRATTWEQRGGAKCLRLEISSAYSVAGAGEQGGQPLDVSGTGTRSGVQFVAVDGRYMGGEAHDSSSITVGLPMQGMTVPVRQITHSTVAVLP